MSPGTLTPFAPAPVAPRKKVEESIGVDELVVAALLLFLVCVSTLTSPIPDAWVSNLTKAGVLCFTSIWILQRTWKERPITIGRSFVFLAAIPILGAAQLLARVTAYPHATRESVAYWASLACVTLLAGILCRQRRIREAVLLTLVFLALGMALFNMSAIANAVDLRTLADGTFWKSIGLFASSNHCAELMELALPIALARMLMDRKRWLFFGLVSAVLFAAVLGCRSRMGSVLAAGEIAAVLLLARRERRISRRHWLRVAGLVLVLSVGLSAAVGIGGLMARLRDRNPFAGRREVFAATLQAASQKPLTGFGLGTFEEVYPAFAVADLGGVVKYAHDEWLEAVCDGGLVMMALLLIVFVRAIRPAMRSLWGVGIVAILLHGAVDFPLQRLSIAAWTSILIGAMEAEFLTKSTDSLPASVRRPAFPLPKS